MKLKPYTILKHEYAGEKRAWVIGAGTSLYYEWMQCTDRNKIFDDLVISVNSSIWTMPWFEDGEHPNKLIKEEIKSDRRKRVWLSNDSLARIWGYWPHLRSKRCKCVRIVRDSWKPYYNELHEDDLYFSPRKTAEDIIDPGEENLAYCSSVPSGIDFAIQMSCKEVMVLGLDHYFLPDGKSHFWQLLEKRFQPIRQDRGMTPLHMQKEVFEKYNNKAFKALENFAKIKRTKILNCSPLSHVDVFEKTSFQDIIK